MHIINMYGQDYKMSVGESIRPAINTVKIAFDIWFENISRN